MTSSDSKASTPRLRVAVADNDFDALDLVASDLQAEGHVIVGRVTQAEDAVALCVSEKPDVLVLDYRMPPGPNGLDVVERLIAAVPGMRIILHSNYRDPAISQRAAKLGVRVLPKGNIRALRLAVAGLI